MATKGLTNIIAAAKSKFQRTYPGVKCTFDTSLIRPAFTYQDGPSIHAVEALLAEYSLPVVRLVNANLLGRAARAFLGRWVNADNSFATRGFTKGYITPSANYTLDEIEAATKYAQGLDAAEMQRLG